MGQVLVCVSKMANLLFKFCYTIISSFQHIKGTLQLFPGILNTYMCTRCQQPGHSHLKSSAHITPAPGTECFNTPQPSRSSPLPLAFIIQTLNNLVLPTIHTNVLHKNIYELRQMSKVLIILLRKRMIETAKSHYVRRQRVRMNGLGFKICTRIQRFTKNAYPFK